MSKNLRGLSERKGIKHGLFEEIKKVSSESSETREGSVRVLSDEYLTGKASILGANSFYDFLSSEHRQKKVYICDGSACLTSGKQEELRNALCTFFSEEDIGTVTCIGHCHTNYSFMYNNATYSLDDLAKLGGILQSGSHAGPVFSTGTNAEHPVLLGDNKVDYHSIIKKCTNDVTAALREIEKSALRGRGGAGFPFHIKVDSVRNAPGDKKYIVCNADEGDPGAFSDKWLLEERPYLVLAGMTLCGIITGAETGVIYVRGEYPESVKAVKHAVAQFEKDNLSGSNISGTGFSFTFNVIEGAGAYICGEETSLLNSLEGLRPEVRTRPPFPAHYGLFGKPTLLSNVETFANIMYILQEGGALYAAPGTPSSAGTKLVSLDGAFNRPGVYEVKMGTPLSVVFNEMGGGTRYPVKAYQIGGPLGGILPAERIADINLDFESFTAAGFLLGHAGVVSIPDSYPIISYLLHLFEFTAKESCGKCFPCRIGSERGSELLQRAIEKKEKIDRDLFNDLIETLELGSLCALGGGLPLPVRNVMHYFGSELEEFFNV
jgi:NADH:ubiquinone oxidoreductase subunit F (NADH-binding)/NADH:ubiquinone oxidoreductase subunit E